MNDYIKDYIDSRLKTLRSLYKDTGDSTYRHKFDELTRFKEVWRTEQIRREQDSGQSKRGTYNPASFD